MERSIGVAQLLMAKPGNRDAEFLHGLATIGNGRMEA